MGEEGGETSYTISPPPPSSAPPPFPQPTHAQPPPLSDTADTSADIDFGTTSLSTTCPRCGVEVVGDQGAQG